MNRTEALEALQLRIKDSGTLKHALLTEAIMHSLAARLHEEQALWAMTGLVHNIDAERIGENTKMHGLLGGDILEGLDFDETLVYAVRSLSSHNEYPRRRKIDKALFCSSAAAAFVQRALDVQSLSDYRPQNADVRREADKGSFKPFDDLVELLKQRMEDPEATEEDIKKAIHSSDELELALNDFLALVLDALKSV